MRYKVIFTGKIAKGYILEKVKRNISEYFKLDPAEVDNLFSKTPITVKNNTDHRTALKIKTAMEKAGALCRILKAEKNETKALHGKAKGVVEHKTNEEDMITCPKCGFHQKKTEACPKCGIIFRKFYENVKVSKSNPAKGTKTDNYSILNRHSEREKQDWMPAAVLGVILTIFLIVFIRSLFLFHAEPHDPRKVLGSISEKLSSVLNKPRSVQNKPKPLKNRPKPVNRKTRSVKNKSKPKKIKTVKAASSLDESGHKTATTVAQKTRVLTPVQKNNSQPANNLIAIYSFSGNANDESGNGNHGTVYGASPVKDRFGNEDSAYSFDGVNDYVDIGRPLVSGDFTISFWLKSNGRQNRFAVPVSQGNMSYRGFNFNFTKGPYNGFNWGTWNEKKVSDSHWGKSAWHTIDFNFPKNINTDLTWHHLTATRKGNTIAVYRDGIIQGIASNFPINYGSFKFNIGRASGNRDFNHRTFNGVIDDIRIYNRALSGAEITDLYKKSG